MSISRRHGRVALCGVLCALCCLLLAACGGREPADDVVPGGTVILEPPSANGDGDAGLKERSLGPSPAAPATVVTPAAAPAPGAVRPSAPAVAPAWQELSRRLAADGISGPQVDALLAGLPATPTQSPMGRKIKELYTKAFAPKPKPTPPSSKPTTPARPKPLVYPGVISAENVEKCRAFLEANKPAFDYAERTFGVPRQISVSLLFVETRLGTFLGKEKAFYTLASMASSRRPEAISTYVAQLPGSTAADRQSWIQQRMEQRSDWAYKELVALLKNIRSSGEDALAMPGSIYGAIGLCQFMPTNISHYGADGNGDGVVNLFTVPDAVASLSNYLAQHGWNKAATRAQKQKVIKTYNRIDIYANTILGLAEAQGYVAE